MNQTQHKKDWLAVRVPCTSFTEEAISNFLFESGSDQGLDYTIVVNAPVDLRIQRIKERDGLSEKMIRSRMQNQWSAEKIRALADWVIENDEKHLILPQVLSIHEQLIS